MRKRPAPVVIALLALLALAAVPDDGPRPEEPRVVVGTADSGINPYHDWFKVAEPSVTAAVLEDFGIDEGHVLHVGESFAADQAAGTYDDVVVGEDYWFAGTNIIARAQVGDTPFLDLGDEHGVGVTAAIAAGNPEAIIYFAQSSGSLRSVFEHPLVDIVSSSHGLPTSAPVGQLPGSYDGVVDGGKLAFAATANDPTLAPIGNAGGPWWSIGVSGFEEGTSEGKTLLAASLPEFVADQSQALPYCSTCTDEVDGRIVGTSFATPLAAGTVSRVLLEARRAVGHLGGITSDRLMVDAGGVQISNWDLRRALEEAAHVPKFTVNIDNLADASVPVNPVAPHAQVGWGVLTPDPEHGVVTEALAHLGFGEPTRTQTPEACQFMTTHMLARMATWDLNPTAASFGQTNALGDGPYVFC